MKNFAIPYYKLRKKAKPEKDLRVPILLLLTQEILGEIGGGNKTGPGKGTQRPRMDTDISGSDKGTQNARKPQKGDNPVNLRNP